MPKEEICQQQIFKQWNEDYEEIGQINSIAEDYEETSSSFGKTVNESQNEITENNIDKIAEGRVGTGEMAVGLGLVDKLGGIDDALAAAAKRANVENYTIISYPEKESLFMNLLNSQRKHYVNSQMKEYMGSFYSYFEILQNLKEINPVQARMPFELNIK